MSSRIAQQRIKDRAFGEGYNEKTTGSMVLEFGRTKLAPVPGYFVTGLNNWKNVVGQVDDKIMGYKVHPSIATASSLFLPLSMQDVGDNMNEQGAVNG